MMAWRRVLMVLLPCLGLPGLSSARTVSEPARHEYKITGVVVSRDGSPVARCHLEVLPPARATAARRGGGEGGGLGRPGVGGRAASGVGPGTQEAITDVHGHFSVTVSHAGLWRVRATARGFRTQDYDQHENYFSSIAVSDATPEVTITFRLVPEAVISGRVLDEAGEPIRQAQVRLETLRPMLPWESFRRGQSAGFAQTDDLGHYELAGLGPGEYRLMVQARPWYAAQSGPRNQGAGEAAAAALDPSLDVVYPAMWFPGVTEQAAAGVLALHGGEEQQADFNLVPMASIHLKIPQEEQVRTEGQRSNAIRPPSLSDALSLSPMFNVRSSSDNKYWDVSGLTPGTYQVRLAASNGKPARVVDMKVQAGSPGVLALDAAVEETQVSLELTGDGTGAAVVVFVNPDTGQTYMAAGGNRRGGRQRNNDEGDDPGDDRRTLQMPAHRYEIRVSGSPGAFVSGISATGAQVKGHLVEIGGGSPVVTIAMSTGRAEVSGVSRLDGKIVAGAMVLLVPASYGEAGGETILRDQTNTDGSFQLQNVVPGPYILTVVDHGWDVNWQDPATLTRYLTSGVPLELKPGATVKQDVAAQTP